MRSACNCCQEPPCIKPVLEYLSVTDSCSICGFSMPSNASLTTDDAGKKFETETHVQHMVLSAPAILNGNQRTNLTVTTDCTTVYKSEEDNAGICTRKTFSSIYHQVSHSYVEQQVPDSDPLDWTFVTETNNIVHTEFIGGICTAYLEIVVLAGEGTSTGPIYGGSCEFRDYTGTLNWALAGRVYTNTITHEYVDSGSLIGTETQTVTFSDEKNHCDCAFPEFPAWPADPPVDLVEGQGRDGVAVRDWSLGGVTKTETKIKWRITHHPTGTCYLKVWIRRLFHPTDDNDDLSADTTTDLTYEWIPTTNPCIDDPSQIFLADDNLVYGDANDEGVPESNATVSFSVLKYSCVRGYEPDDPLGPDDPPPDPEDPVNPNGFPIPHAP